MICVRISKVKIISKLGFLFFILFLFLLFLNIVFITQKKVGIFVFRRTHRFLLGNIFLFLIFKWIILFLLFEIWKIWAMEVKLVLFFFFLVNFLKILLNFNGFNIFFNFSSTQSELSWFILHTYLLKYFIIIFLINPIQFQN